MYKPGSYPDVSPYLIVADAQATLDFLKQVFGAGELRVHRDSEGNIAHAEARVGDSVIMAGQMADGPEAHVHIYTEDAEEAFARAKAAGGIVVQEQMVKEDGDLRGGIRDANGTTWWISRQMAPET